MWLGRVSHKVVASDFGRDCFSVIGASEAGPYVWGWAIASKASGVAAITIVRGVGIDVSNPIVTQNAAVSAPVAQRIFRLRTLIYAANKLLDSGSATFSSNTPPCPAPARWFYQCPSLQWPRSSLSRIQ